MQKMCRKCQVFVAIFVLLHQILQNFRAKNTKTDFWWITYIRSKQLYLKAHHTYIATIMAPSTSTGNETFELVSEREKVPYFIFIQIRLIFYVSTLGSIIVGGTGRIFGILAGNTRLIRANFFYFALFAYFLAILALFLLPPTFIMTP